MKALRYLNKFLWKYRGRLFTGVLFIALANLGNVWAPEIVKEGIDYLVSALKDHRLPVLPDVLVWVPGLSRWLNASEFSSAIAITGLALGVLYLILYLVKGVFLFYQRQTIIVMSRYIEYDLKNEIYNHYQKLDTAFFRRNRAGDLMNRISEDVNRVRMYLGPGIMYTINLVIMVVFSVIFMVREDPELTLYTLLPLPFMMICIFYVSRLINRRTEKVQQQQSRLSVFVQEAFSGIRVLKAFQREDHSHASFEKECNFYKEKQLRLVRTDALFMPVIVLLVGLSTIGTIYIGAQKVMAGEITAGVLFKFVYYVNLMTWPFAMVGWVTSLVQKAAASQARINEFLQTEPAIQNQAQKVSWPTPLVRGDIEFRNVSFTYPDTGIEALRSISFRVRQGETLAIIGRTGSGKTTIAQLICRMYEATTGEVLIDGIPIGKHDLHRLRRSIGYVPQDTFLFSDTVANNIAFGLEHADDERIRWSAEQADVHQNILEFREGYSTLLGERGINLSGGQKQRVAIARALAVEPSVLVLDDCLSAVDTQTEENILASLGRIMRDRTSIVIAHRVSSIRHADRILVIEQGSIAEEGSHDQLVERNGLYAAIYRRQLLDEG